MKYTLDQVVPWGRSFHEYTRIFDLSLQDLDKKILGCGDGPASFNCEATALGHHVISVDPIYAFSRSQISQRIDEVYEPVVSQLWPNLNDYMWTDFKDPNDLGQYRLRCMHTFLDDFEKGLAQQRYRVDALPNLNFGDQEFDLALCSHLLFLYSEQLSYQFHRMAIEEMCRVAREVRIFPLTRLDCQRSQHIQPLVEHFHAAEYQVELRKVNYEFQRGSNQMMRIYQTNLEIHNRYDQE